MISKLTIPVGVILVCLGFSSVSAQTRWQKYDSIYAERIFSPTFSTFMMPKGYVEVIVNNSLLSTNNYWDYNRSLQGVNNRTTYNYTTLQTNIGVSNSGRISLGVDLYYVQGRRDADPNSSPFYIFNSNAQGNTQSARGLTAISPRLKIVPSRRYKNLIYQTAVVIPLIKNNDIKDFLGQSNTVWNNQLLYSVRISKKFITFGQAEVDVSFKKTSNTGGNQYYTPVNVYAYCLLTKHIYPFASIGYAAVFQKDAERFKKQVDFIPAGLGLQYQFSLRVNVNAYYTQYLSAQNYSNWRTLNIGVRGVF